MGIIVRHTQRAEVTESFCLATTVFTPQCCPRCSPAATASQSQGPRADGKNEKTHQNITHNNKKNPAGSYLSCQFRICHAASTVVFKTLHLYSHSTEQWREVGVWGGKETERKIEVGGGEKENINQ